MTQPIPLLDIAPFFKGGAADKADIAKGMNQAFEEIGFLVITGHGVDETLVQSLYDTAKQFFALPLGEKDVYSPAKRSDNVGYIAMGRESVASTLAGETPPDLCEAFVYKSFFQERAANLAGTAIWRNHRPVQPAQFARLGEQYYWEVDRLASDLYRIVAIALGLAEDYFKPLFQEHWNTLRIVNYPDQTVDPLPGQLRYGAHHDYGGLTILRQDAAPGGLEICDREGRWHEAPIIPGSFLINIGDMMSRWTNGRWRSTLHRVTNPPRHLSGSTQRLSIVTFVRPDDEAEIVALPGCVDAEHPALFPPIKAGVYSRGKISTSSLDKAVHV